MARESTTATIAGVEYTITDPPAPRALKLALEIAKLTRSTAPSTGWCAAKLEDGSDCGGRGVATGPDGLARCAGHAKEKDTWPEAQIDMGATAAFLVGGMETAESMALLKDLVSCVTVPGVGQLDGNKFEVHFTIEHLPNLPELVKEVLERNYLPFIRATSALEPKG